jgi:uncharacterized protein (DUF4415 family)
MSRKKGKPWERTGFDDSPELTAKDFTRMRPMKEVMPEVVEAFKRGRGRPKLEHPKERVSLRVDHDVVAAFKATGDGWQARMNDVLARAATRLKPRRRAA